MNQQWHLLQDGQRFGPYSADQLVEYAADGRIVRDSMLWTEGLADWVKASEVEGLFPAAPAPLAAPAYVPGGANPPWMRGAAAQTPMARPGFGLVVQAVPGENYPPTDTKGAWFGLLVALAGGGGALGIVLVVLLVKALATAGEGGGRQIVPLVILLVLCGAAIITAAIIQYIYIGRLWSCLRYSNPRTTAGKAVGFLFIPLFNFYWIFTAFHGLAQDWNRITSQHPDLARMPKMSEPLFLTFCICTLAVAPVGAILWFPVMAQICRSINAIAYRPVQRPGIFNIG